MKIRDLFEGKESKKIPPSKPRDPNTKTLQNIRSSGAAGAHKDKKKAMKQGDVKHKGKVMAESAEPNISTLDAVFNEQDFYRLENIWPALEEGDKEEALRQINHYLRKGKNRAWWGDLQAVDINIDANDIENSQIMWSKPIKQNVAEAEPVPGKYSGHFYDAEILPNGDYKIVKVNSKKDENGNSNPLNLEVGDVVPKGKAYSLQYSYDGGMFDELNRGVAEYGDTARGQKMLTKVQKRATDRMIKADDKRDAKAAKKNQDTANRAWDRITDKD